jgi:cholesterol oxidase
VSHTHFDAVIVGSGFGGSVMAYRLAKANLNVCLLERGKAYPPGSFPRTPWEMSRNFWDPSEGLYGMFDVWSFRGGRRSLKGIDAVISSGLGGGSLTYANVLLRKDENWFVQEDLQNGGYEYWPVKRADLDPHYDEVEKMLGAQKYPFEKYEPYNLTPKTAAFKQASERIGLHWELPPLAVTFANDGEAPETGAPIRETAPNYHRKQRYTCQLCGECDIGCNYGSKNTLDYNYLTAAQDSGATILPLCEVRDFHPGIGDNASGYTVRYVKHDPESYAGRRRETSELPHHTITTNQLILSAGTLGTNYLLLKNREFFPGLSEQLGSRFSGNGDLLTFVSKARERRGRKMRPLTLDPSRGPVITSAARSKDELDGGTGRGFYIEDAGYPNFLNWIIEVNAPRTTGRVVRMLGRWLWRSIRSTPQSNLSGELSRVFGDGTLASGSLPLLGMGRDIPDGLLTIEGKYLQSDWNIGASSDFFDRLRDTMKAIADELNGRFINNPIWGLNRVITVHPLGGCPMGRNEREGVVDSYGRVFGHPGLYVADGSVMPGPVGPNPSLTIAALADRFADQVIEDAKQYR